jgi:lipoate-protein ligase A
MAESGTAAMEQEVLFEELVLWMDPELRSGAVNMAVDQALLEWGCKPVLRVYGWRERTVTLGYAQSRAKLAEGLPEGWPVVRRWTGGGVVFHGEDHTYTLMVPAGHPWAEVRPVESYRLIHQRLADGLVSAGFVGCRLALAEDVIDLPFCFQAPALHDVIRGTVKVAGAGQRRGRLGLLHQGSVQQVALADGFWRQWAAGLAGVVDEWTAVPGGIMERAAVLAERRYELEQWLESRDDEL